MRKKMGTTCFCYVEYPTANGNWVCLGEVHLSKNYHLFAALCGVRNGVWGMHVTPISPPRDLPRDVTPEVAKEADEMRGYCHSHSWLSVEELLRFDWDQEVPYKTRINVADPHVRKWFEQEDRRTAPPKGAFSVTSGNEITPQEVQWTQKLRVDVKDFLDGVLPYLKYLAFDYIVKAPNTRIVFWFKD